MKTKHRMMIFFFILSSLYDINDCFNPNKNDYDAYGLKIAMNELLFVQAQNINNPPTFFIQFAPYNNTPSSPSIGCSIFSPNTTDHFIYTVTVAPNQTQFFFAGELINGRNGTFIGAVKFNLSSATCSGGFTFFLQYFYQYKHQEYYIIGVESNGRYVYGFANEFIYVFDSQINSILNIWNGNLTWPDRSFIPHAVDFNDIFGVIAGFIRNPSNTSVSIFIPIVYLINFNSSNHYPIIVDAYRPATTPNTWQDLLSNSDADQYSAKYDMSVDINRNGSVLVGMQFVNRVFLFTVNVTRPVRLNYINRNTNGRSLGNGKNVAWLDNGIAAVLLNTYSLNYQWLSSSIYFYDIQSYGWNSNSIPLSTFPNTHQLLPTSFNMIFLNIISTPSSVALQDNAGNILIFSLTPAGYYPFVQDLGSIPVFTTPKPCLAGTYKNQPGVHDCLLCPNGTKNSGNSSLQCLSCLPESFCPLGSVDDIPQSALKHAVQVFAYPQSPESTIFDEILIQNMFSIGSGRCLLVSPLFWTIIVATLAFTMIMIMHILKNYITHHRAKSLRSRLERSLKQIDIINEGECWIGGLITLAVIVLVCFAYAFSSQFSKQYPLEQTADSYFACDLSLRNAKFATNIQSLSIAGTESEKKIFDLLDEQILSLNVDFINTLIDCSAISLQALYGTYWNTIRWDTCGNHNSILSLSITLPYQRISVQILIADVQIMGALGIGLSGNGSKSEHYQLKTLNTYQSFAKSGQVLAQNLPITLSLTKVINETKPMTGDESDYTAIYIPTFTIDPNSLFLSASQYIRLTSTSIKFQIDIQETPYYVKNVQQPIAKTPEIVFHNLLFTVVSLEIFGLGYLLYRLIIKPLFSLIYPRCFNNRKNKVMVEMEEINHITPTF